MPGGWRSALRWRALLNERSGVGMPLPTPPVTR